MRWTFLNYLSSLTNTSDLSTLLRSATLTKLMSGAIYLLSVKIAEKQNYGQNNEALYQKVTKYKRKGESSKTKELVPMLKDLNLGYPT